MSTPPAAMTAIAIVGKGGPEADVSHRGLDALEMVWQHPAIELWQDRNDTREPSPQKRRR